jgi:hypothetical protein
LERPDVFAAGVFVGGERGGVVTRVRGNCFGEGLGSDDRAAGALTLATRSTSNAIVDQSAAQSAVSEFSE